MSGLPSAIVQLFTGAQAGKSHLAATGSNNRYARISSQSLSSWALAGDVSSATLFMPEGGACTLLLFTHDGLTIDDYQGQFIEYVNFSGNKWDVGLKVQEALDSGNWNNRPTSGLVVRSQVTVETRLSAVSEWLPGWVSATDSLLPSGVSRDGNPTFKWEPFPVGSQYLSPNVIYVKVRQALIVEVPVLNDYAAAFSYWIRLLINPQGRVTGHVGQWRVWVEAGLKASEIKDELKAQISAATPTVNSLIAGWGLTKPSPLADVYFLPGVPVPPTQGGSKDIFKGFTDGDVTIVLANPPQVPT
jgi:hypothetical protein